MNKYCANFEVAGSGATEGVGYSIGFGSPHAINSSMGAQIKRWMDELGKLVRAEGDSPFNGSSEVRQKAIDRLALGIQAINNAYIYDISTYDDVPAVQITSVDGRKIEIDLHKTSRDVSISESFQTPEIQTKVSDGGIENFGRHRRGAFDFQGAVALHHKLDRPATR